MSPGTWRLAVLLPLAALWACQEQGAPLPPPPAPAPAAAPEPPPAAQRLSTLEEPPGASYFAGEADGKLHVWFLDVGQGDAVLIKSPTGRTVLVDGGPPEAGSRLAARLPELLSGPLDMVVVTHVHEDHYGALPRLLQTVGVRRFLVPRTVGGPEPWAALLALAGSREIPLFMAAPSPERPREPLVISLGGDVALRVHWPRAPLEPLLDAADPDEANSVVMRLVHGDTSVLLAGDATDQTERHLLGRQVDLRATVLKVAAHGDDTASGADFLTAVQPQAAIISAGAGNARGSPSRAVLSRLQATGADVYRTDLDGELRLEGNGRQLVLFKERPAVGEAPDVPHLYGRRDPPPSPPAATRPPRPARPARPPPAPKKAAATQTPMAAAGTRVPKGAFVASRNGEVFHVPDCRNAQRILEKNLVVYRTRKEAEKERRPAGDCNP
jgi:competence protein ComEC